MAVAIEPLCTCLQVRVVNFVILAAFLVAFWALVVELFLEEGIVVLVLYLRKRVYQPGRMGSFF